MTSTAQAGRHARRTMHAQKFIAVISQRHLLGSAPNRPFLAGLGWNSYGTEGAQPVAKVGVA
jgi:hypothetical protein